MIMDQTIIKILQEIQKSLAKVVTKKDLNKALAKYATKGDLLNMEKRLKREIRETETFAIITADKHKAEKSIVENHERRLIRIESKFAA